MNKIDVTIKPIIMKMMDLEFEVIEKNVVKEIEGDVISPNEIQQEIVQTYDIHIEFAYLIVYEWLFLNGLENIQSNWFGRVFFNGYSDSIHTFGGPNNQLTIEYGDDFLNTISSGITNTIIIGNNNTVTTSNTVVIGNNYDDRFLVNGDNRITVTTGATSYYSINDVSCYDGGMSSV